MATITETQMARIDTANDERRNVFNILVDGGFDPDGIRHGIRANAGRTCPDYCITCRNNRAHATCVGCPDC
jgi:hypothetical protein